MNTFEGTASSLSTNQGIGGFPIRMGRIRAIIFTPESYSITPLQALDIRTKLKADAIVDSAANRIQVLGRIAELNNNTGDVKKQEFGYGGSKSIYYGNYAFTVVPWDNDLQLLFRMQRFNGRADEFRALLVDEDYNIFGTKTKDGTGENIVQGFTLMDVFAAGAGLDSGDGVKNGITLAFEDAQEMNEGNLVVIAANFNVWKEVKCLADVELTLAAAVTTGAASIIPMSGNKNLAASLPIVTITNVANWIVKNKTTGTILTPTSIGATVVNGQAGVKITIPTTGSYPTTGQQLSITMAAPSVLSANGMKYLECVTTIEQTI